jgi:hypothetical protein
LILSDKITISDRPSGGRLIRLGTKTVINFVDKPTQSHNQILLKRLSIVVLCKVDYRLLGKKRE